jgi:hypothetical protein
MIIYCSALLDNDRASYLATTNRALGRMHSPFPVARHRALARRNWLLPADLLQYRHQHRLSPSAVTSGLFGQPVRFTSDVLLELALIRASALLSSQFRNTFLTVGAPLSSASG